jgi:hypothetical protein
MASDRVLENAANEVKEFAKMGLLRKSVPAQDKVLLKCPSLRELPQTQEAASELPTPQFEYLVQAIVDAVDAIELRGHRLDAASLRALFGLVDPVRRANWSRRQEEAARVQGVGRDHFRRNLQAPLLKAIAELLLSGSSEQATKNAEIQEQFLSAAPTQDGLVTWMTKYIVDNTPREAILLELSTATIGPILDALRAANVEARLLVANPYMAQSAWLQERHWMTLLNRFQRDFAGYANLEVRMYDVPPSLRGRLIGDWFSLGWYTYRDDARLEAAEDPNAALIFGHDNAMIHGSVVSNSGAVLAEWFRKEFERLWRHRLTRRGSDVGRTLGLQD